MNMFLQKKNQQGPRWLHADRKQWQRHNSRVIVSCYKLQLACRTFGETGLRTQVRQAGLSRATPPTV